MPKTAGIILIGNEILSGKTVDANAAYLCRELRELGVEVRRVVVTIEGVARAMGVPVVRHPELVALLERYYRDKVTDAALRMAEIPEGAELITGNGLRFPNVAMRNVYVLPGVPEIFRRKFDAMRERFRDAPIHLKNVFVRIGEGTLADYLNRLLDGFPLLLVGSYPELSNPEYQVKVTLESRDRGYLEQALADFLGRLPGDAVVKVT